jgi:mannitol-1-phosphate 5-dehydrogenase
MSIIKELRIIKPFERSKCMKKAVHFGPGNIGMGLFGQMYYESGYEIVFVGRSRWKIDLLNQDRQYPLAVFTTAGNEISEITIENVRGVCLADQDDLSKEISDADMISTAVMFKNLPGVAGPLSEGLKARWEAGNMNPINILLGENSVETDKYFADLLDQHLKDEKLIELRKRLVGLVETCPFRGVPAIPEEMRKGNPLRVYARDPFSLPFDKDAIKGPLPNLKYAIPQGDFEFRKKQKIFVGNCGHAITAYLGHLKGATKLSEATANDRIVNISALASLEAGIGLCLEFDMPMDEMIDTVKSRRTTRRNVGVDDTIARVGREPLRKLSDNERFMGGAKLALKHGFVPLNLCLSAAAAMHFELPDDPESVQLQNMIKSGGPEKVLREVCNLEENSILWNLILNFYHLLGDKTLF